MSTVHYITKCKICAVTISQCRCMFGDKIVKEGICSNCQNEIKEIPCDSETKKSIIMTKENNRGGC